ncbi:unnamed protein product [Brachionus calyciflorus]|uniref:SH2 domain-containing protein n=1 Tax=Brachionus calyciflorus TaxID=104777 RepID=A0A813VMT2_9BILA|nr:unnamed protein product [Brachionus calyciflorus]
MNSFFGRIKLKQSNKNSKKSKVKSKIVNEDDIEHNYHIIDEDVNDKKLKYFTRLDRVESFEFINLNKQNHMDSKCVKYETSWEESTINLVNDFKANFIRSSNRFSLRENNSKSYQLHNNQNLNTHRSSYPPEIKTSHQLNNSLDFLNFDRQIMVKISFFNKKREDIERLLSGSLNDNDNKTMIDSSGNSFSSKDSLCDVESISEPWYQLHMSRENVLNYLIDQEIGSFIIRLSTSCKNCYALSIRVPYFANQNPVAHYLITKNTYGYKLKGVEKDFKSLKSLVTHYSVMQEILPVTLNLTKYRYEKSGYQVRNNSNCSHFKQSNFLMSHHHNIKNLSCLIK